MHPSSRTFSKYTTATNSVSKCFSHSTSRTVGRTAAVRFSSSSSHNLKHGDDDNAIEPATESSTSSASSTNLTGSAKLFLDATLEESDTGESHLTTSKPHLHPHRPDVAAAARDSKASTTMSKIQRLHTEHLQFQHPNWTGDESTEDAVLRMLVDKYKPLRSGTVQSAEEKLHKAGPKVQPTSPIAEKEGMEGRDSVKALLEKTLGAVDVRVDGASGYRVQTPPPPTAPLKTGSWASEPLLPSSPDHMPWHTVFKPPANWSEKPAIKHAKPIASSKMSRSPGDPNDPKAKRKEREERKRSMTAGRLGSAREATLDYRLGVKGEGGERVGTARVNPTSVKGWTSLVEDRIEKARKAGAFNAVKGRGQPLARSTDEHNPFIAREEFLMNRIVQRNGAAPPWVELQTDLESAASAFRTVLLESWVRTASRNISSSLPPPSDAAIYQLPSVEALANYRDREWEKRELGYHTAAVQELNSLVRKYNGLAPYPVRRPPYTVEAERERAYREGAKAILEALKNRGRGGRLDAGVGVGGGGGGVAGGGEGVWEVKEDVGKEEEGRSSGVLGRMIRAVVRFLGKTS